MRSQGAIRQQLKQVIYRNLQRKLRKELKHTPENCMHNADLDVVGVPRFCSYRQGSDDWNRVICDRNFDGERVASECPFFDTVSAQDIKDEFGDLIRNGPRSEIAAQYPDIAALLWVLDEESSEAIEDDCTETLPLPKESVFSKMIRVISGG